MVGPLCPLLQHQHTHVLLIKGERRGEAILAQSEGAKRGREREGVIWVVVVVVREEGGGGGGEGGGGAEGLAEEDSHGWRGRERKR